MLIPQIIATGLMSDAEKSPPAPSIVDEVDDPDGDPPHHDEDHFHSGPHHDEDLKPYQRTIIWSVAPSLLVNVPHPWTAFICLVFLHLALFVGSVLFLRQHCQYNEHEHYDWLTFRGWSALLDKDKFECLYFIGELKPTGNEVFIDPVNRTTPLDPAQRMLYPCVPMDGSDFVRIYRDHSGDTEDLSKNFYCPNWDPNIPNSAYEGRFGVLRKPMGYCTTEPAPTDRMIPGTAHHERRPFLINYTERVCPAWAGSGRYRRGIQNPHIIFVVLVFVLALLVFVCWYVSSSTQGTRRGRGLMCPIDV